ncbi:MAG: hypothetical protein GF329_02335 [Candidatus Lokiarchaeota archaeon]|nr:hypothetical protein [Candidatus Lokiarchaeota archaeon]
MDKLALPIINRKDEYCYFDVGHRSYSNYSIYLWAIDNRFKFHEREMLFFRCDTHPNWHEIDWTKVLAWGRSQCDKETNLCMCSMLFNDLLEGQRKSHVRKKVEKILDRRYNNPKIIEYDESY